MSIAIIAPTKFDFQDLACVELGLRWPEDGAPTLQAEPENGEDAVLTWEEGGQRRLCEVQVKGRSTGEFDMATLADYLAHFPDRQAQGCLLERLIDHPEQMVLFVASERCRDETARYRAPVDWTGAYRAGVPDQAAGFALAAALQHLAGAPGRMRNAPSKLMLARAAHLGALAKTPAGELAAALERVFIHELETPAVIVVRLHRKLFAAGVPTDRLADGVARLKQVVADDRAARLDLFGRLRMVLADFAPERMMPARYLPRGVEDKLAADLARQGAVLLSGAPRVGKSWTALRLAGGLQQQGYEVARSSHIDQADRFLNDPVRHQRAYVLEDPLGARQAVSDASTRVADLRRLLDGLPAHRRLIVAQSDAPILQTLRQPDLADCNLGAFTWNVIGPLPQEHAEALWRRDATDAGVPSASIEQVVAVVRAHPDLRDAGALAYLATNFDRLRPGAGAAEIIAQARGDAVDFAQVLADESAAAGKVLRGVAVATETGLGVAEAELAFVMDGGEERPNFDKSRGIVVLSRSNPLTSPAYQAAPALDQPERDATLMLRRRRVLDLQAGRHNFVHPYLRAGAQAVFRPDLEEDVHAAVAFVQRALSAVDPRISLAAARNLPWIAAALEAHPDGLSKAAKLAQSGLGSLYPATRDACFAFLMSRASDLPYEEQRRLRRWVHAVDVDFDRIEEVGGVLLVTSGMNSLFERSSVPLERVLPYVEAIEAGQPLDLDPPLAFAIIVASEQAGRDLSPLLMERLLSTDAAVLRAAAASLWLERAREGDEHILARIAADPIPPVSNAVLDVLVRAWTDLPPARRSTVAGLLEAHARQPGSATTLLDRLSKFNREEEFGEAPPWPLFARLAPSALANAPDAVFRDGRFASTVAAAIRAGQGIRLRRLLTVWATGLAKRLKTKLPDEFELSVPEPLLDVAPPAWRWRLIRGLLDAPNTGARLRTTATLVDRWASLSEPERRELLEILRADPGDGDWLRAAALTRLEVPAEITQALRGRADLLELEPAELLDVLGEPLYRASLHVFLGEPQPLWWLGSHHSSAPSWRRAVRWSASAADRPLFAEALDDVIAFAEDDEPAALVRQAAEGDLQAVFTVFLRRKVGETGNWQTGAWTVLLDRGTAAGFAAAWFAQIAEAAPVFLDHLRDVRHWLGEGPHENRLLQELASDFDAYKLLHTAKELVAARRRLEGSVESPEDEGGEDGKDDEVEGLPTLAEALVTFLGSIKTFLEDHPPRLLGTWGDLRDDLKALDAPEELLGWLETKRLEVLELRSEELPGLLKEDRASPLVGWVGPR